MAASLAGCRHETQARKIAAPTAPADPWVLTTFDASSTTPALLWNGKLGVRLGRDASGTDLPCFLADQYQADGEEKLVALRSPLAATVKAGGIALSPTGAPGYCQSLDMRTGLLNTSWTQQARGVRVKIDVTTAIDPERPVVAQRWSIQPDKKVAIEFASGAGVAWTGSAEDANGTLTGPRGPVAVRLAHSTSVARRWSGASEAGYVWSDEASNGVQLERLASFGCALPASYEAVAQRSAKAWAKRWTTDVVIDGPVEDQQAVRSFLFYLRSSFAPDNPVTVSPFSLADATYSGHVFWDADVWVFPALALVDPNLATGIPRYRLAKLGAARAGFQRWRTAGYPTAKGKLKPDPKLIALLPGAGSLAAKYPWESSVSGRETVPGASRFEDHMTGSVTWSLEQAAALGLISEADLTKVRRSAAAFWLHRASLRPDGKAVIRDTMSPDESHVGDNDLYTNLLADRTLRAVLGAKWPAGRMTFPHDATGYLTYDGDSLRSYKQAAAVLAVYPLQDPEAERQALAMLGRFQDKVIKNGPAMSDSVHAIVQARFGDPDRAYQTWRGSWQAFTAHPLLLFSEKRSRDAAYFTTGAAGCLQSVLYGFCGLRIDTKKPLSAGWAVPLKGGHWLSAVPHLPKAWKRVEFRGLWVLGRRYDLTITPQGVRQAGAPRRGR